MKTEMEKCLAGEWYDCHNQVFLDLKTRTHKLLMKYNSLPYEDKEEKHSLLKKMLGSIGMKVSVASPFICDYGCNIHIGDNVTVNTGCTFVDCNKITIGSNVLIAPNVQLYTATHPIDLDERLAPVETEDGIKRVRRTYALPITIEDGCWIGGGVIILPGITIGYGSVIGAGSVVTKDIPANSLAASAASDVYKRQIPMCIEAFKQAVSPYASKILSKDDIVKTFGLNEEGMIKEVVSEDWEKALIDFYVKYKEMHTVYIQPFAGIRELITELKKNSIIVSLITGKGQRLSLIHISEPTRP